MAYTFEKSQGLPIGKSLVENDKLDLAARSSRGSRDANFRLLLPVDHVLARIPDSTATDHRHREDARRLDGPRHRPENHRRNSAAKSPPRAPSFGTARSACSKCPPSPRAHWQSRRAVAAATAQGATSIVGGGDSVAAVEQSGVAAKSRTSPPAAAPPSNFSRATNSPAWKPSPTPTAKLEGVCFTQSQAV